MGVHFFSLYDLLVDKAVCRSMTQDEMYSYFREKGISKSEINSLAQTAYIPQEDKFQTAIKEFLDMTDLEIELSMGRVPPTYKKSYYENIKNIASLLERSENNVYTDLKPYYENHYGKLFNADCIEVMQGLKTESVDLIFADPPFNLGKTYDPGIEDCMSMSDYINWTYNWLDECVRLLKPGGRIFVYNIPKWCIYTAAHLAETLTFWDWIAIDMKFSLPIQNRLYPAHYGLVSFVKGVKGTTFNNQRIPLQTCRHCGGDIKDYGGYKNKMNPLGVNVSDVWSDIYPVRHRNNKNRKYNELSVKLLERVISMSTNKGDVVFDPFGGSGTTYAVAQLTGRRWIGAELGNCEIIKNRLLNPEQDKEQLQKVKEGTNCLFTPAIEKLRKENGFWTCDTFSEQREKSKDVVQLSFDTSNEK